MGAIPYSPDAYKGILNTQLTPEQEAAFLEWQAANPRLGSDYDYDARGFWQAGAKTDERGHGADQWKKPNHPTFSNQSMYNGYEGKQGGTWQGDQFTPSEINEFYAQGQSAPGAQPVAAAAAGVPQPIAGSSSQVVGGPVTQSGIGPQPGDIAPQAAPTMIGELGRIRMTPFENGGSASSSPAGASGSASGPVSGASGGGPGSPAAARAGAGGPGADATGDVLADVAPPAKNVDLKTPPTPEEMDWLATLGLGAGALAAGGIGMRMLASHRMLKNWPDATPEEIDAAWNYNRRFTMPDGPPVMPPRTGYPRGSAASAMPGGALPDPNAPIDAEFFDTPSTQQRGVASALQGQKQLAGPSKQIGARTDTVTPTGNRPIRVPPEPSSGVIYLDQQGRAVPTTVPRASGKPKTETNTAARSVARATKNTPATADTALPNKLKRQGKADTVAKKAVKGLSPKAISALRKSVR